MATLIELRDERAKLATEMNQMTTLCATEKREFTAEENEKFERIDKDQEKLRSIITNLEKTENLTHELQSVRSTGIGREQQITQAFIKPEDRQLNAFRSYLLNGENHMGASELTDLRALGSYAAGSATPSAGGYAAPSQVTSEFIKMLRDQSGVRSAPCRILPTNSGNDLPYPSFDDTAHEGEQVNENPAGAIGDTTDPSFGQEVLKAYSYDSGVVRISQQLMADSVIPVEQLLNEALAERIGRKINRAYTYGTGTGEPEGITVGAALSDVTIDISNWAANSNGYVYKTMQAIAHSVAPQYRQNKNTFGIMFNDSTLLALKQVVDGQGRPLWNASMSADEPDTVCGMRYYVNQDMGDVTSHHAIEPIIVGDFSKFYIRDVNSLQTQRLNELYARYLQIGFLAWFRTDSRVMNSNALHRVANQA